MALTIAVALASTPGQAAELTSETLKTLPKADVVRTLMEQLGGRVVEVIPRGGLSYWPLQTNEVLLVTEAEKTEVAGVCSSNHWNIAVRPVSPADERPVMKQALGAQSILVSRYYRLLESRRVEPGADPCAKAGPAWTHYANSDHRTVREGFSETYRLGASSQALRTVLMQLRSAGQAWVCTAQDVERAKCPRSERAAIFTLDRLTDLNVRECQAEGTAICIEARFVENCGGPSGAITIEDVWADKGEVSSIGSYKITDEGLTIYH